MKIKVHRRYLGPAYTIGTMYINGERFCDTLEDVNRDKNKNGKFDNGEQKVYSETCIPYGTYEVIVNYSPKMKRQLPRLLNVPSFEGVLIHRGNTAKDSAGCILVGENKVVGKVINSTQYEQRLVALCQNAIKQGEKITIEIV